MLYFVYSGGPKPHNVLNVQSSMKQQTLDLMNKKNKFSPYSLMQQLLTIFDFIDHHAMSTKLCILHFGIRMNQHLIQLMFQEHFTLELLIWHRYEK